MYYLYTNGLYPGAMNATLTHLLKIDMEADPIMTDVFNSQNDELCELQRNTENIPLVS